MAMTVQNFGPHINYTWTFEQDGGQIYVNERSSDTGWWTKYGPIPDQATARALVQERVQIIREMFRNLSPPWAS